MNLHGNIINIQVASWVEDLPTEHRLIFKKGHRDARHEAAELALTYDNLVDTLENNLQTMQKYAESAVVHVMVADMLDTIKKVKSGEYQ